METVNIQKFLEYCKKYARNKQTDYVNWDYVVASVKLDLTPTKQYVEVTYKKNDDSMGVMTLVVKFTIPEIEKHYNILMK